jgi:hypothetical protein
MARSLAWNIVYFLLFSQSFKETDSIVLKLFHDNFLVLGEEFIIRFHTFI